MTIMADIYGDMIIEVEMAEVNEDSSILCRICFNLGSYSLLSDQLNIEGKFYFIGDILRELSNLQTWEIPFAPVMICKECMEQLGQTCIFLRNLECADHRIRENIELTARATKLPNESDVDEDEIKQFPNPDENDFKNSDDDIEILSEPSSSNGNSRCGDGHKNKEFDDDRILSVSPSAKVKHREEHEDDDEESFVDLQYLEIDEESETDKEFSIISDTEEENKGIFQNNQLKHYSRKRKQKLKSTKKEPLILAENVSSASHEDSHVQIDDNIQLDSMEEDSKFEDHPPYKKKKFNNLSLGRFLITKFVPTISTNINHESVPSSAGVMPFTQSEHDDHLVIPEESSSGTCINRIRMFDIAAVEVEANGKIELLPDEDNEEMNIENPNTIYMCQYCSKAFSTSQHLINHQRKSHVCQFCMKTFSKVIELCRHTKEDHSSFTCAICKKDFSNNSNLRQHLKRMHKVELPAHVSLLSFEDLESPSLKPC